jgi:hypothetical protein
MTITVREIICDCIDNLDVEVDANPIDFACNGWIDAIECMAIEAIPTDTKTLLQMAANDLTIALVEPTHELVLSGETSPANLIATNILEQVIDALTNHYKEHHQDRLENMQSCPVCGEIMDDIEKYDACASCGECCCTEHVSINYICPLCQKRFTH